MELEYRTENVALLQELWKKVSVNYRTVSRSRISIVNKRRDQFTRLAFMHHGGTHEYCTVQLLLLESVYLTKCEEALRIPKTYAVCGISYRFVFKYEICE